MTQAAWIGLVGGLALHYHNAGATCGRPVTMWVTVLIMYNLAFLAWRIVWHVLHAVDIKVSSTVQSIM